MEIWREIRREVLTGALRKRAAIAKYKAARAPIAEDAAAHVGHLRAAGNTPKHVWTIERHLRARRDRAANHPRAWCSRPDPGDVLTPHGCDRIPLRWAQRGTLGQLRGLPTALPGTRLKTKKPLRWPLLSAHRRGFTDRGSGRSRTDDGGFAIGTQLSETSDETHEGAASRGASRGNSAAQASAATDVEILIAEWHLLSPEIRVAIMAIFYSSQKAEPDSSAP